MSSGTLFRLVLGALLTLAVALQLARLVDHTANPRLELGEHRRSRLDDRSLERLAALEDPVTLTYVVSSADRMPSSMRRTEREVREVLDAVAQAAPGVVRWRVVDPESDPEQMRFATKRRIAPIRVRGISRDAFAETPVYSSIEIVDASGKAALIDGVGPELVPRIGALIVEHLDLFERPELPRVALSAPAEEFDALRAALAERAQVTEVDLEQPAALDGFDALLWIDPAAPSEAACTAVETFRAQGGGVLVAGSVREPRSGELEGQAAFAFAPTDFDAQRVWGLFGLRTRQDPVFDGLCEAIQTETERIPLPFLVRCIGQNQDFRRMPQQVSGTLLFAGPTPFANSEESLFERGFELRVLATTSEQTYALPELAGLAEPPPMRVAAVTAERGDSLPKQPLIVQLLPADPWAGPVFGLAASSVFRDPYFSYEAYAHKLLLDSLMDALGAQERLVAARADIPRPVPIGDVSPTAELGWRALALLGLPALLAVLALRRGLFRAERGAGALQTALRPLLLGLGGLLAIGLFARALPPGFGRAALGDSDSTSAVLLEPETLQLAEDAAGASGLELEWIQSRSDLLSPGLAGASRRAATLLRELARRTPGTDFERTVPTADDAEALQTRGVESFSDTATEDGQTLVRQIYSTLLVSTPKRTEQLDFPDARAFEDFEFRLAFALWRLSTGSDPLIALATDSPRLSPAEAHTEFQQRKLFAPSGTDVYSLARASLERADFKVVHVEPKRGNVPEEADALFWLQPRRSIEPMLETTIRHLQRGKGVFLAAQHFVLRAERHRGRDFADVYWPQPQSPDVDSLWLPQLGVQLERTVLFDASSFEAPLTTHVNRSGEEREYSEQSSTAGFLVRAGNAQRPKDPLLAGVGALNLAFPNAIRLDAARLAELGLEADVLQRTSPAAWTYAWKGGFLPPDALEGPGPGSSAVTSPDSALLVRLRGRFPDLLAPEEGYEERIGPPPVAETPASAAPATLLLLGASEALKDTALSADRDGARADRLLVNAAAELCLPPELAALAGRRSVPRGLGVVEPKQSLTWRASVLGLPLIGVALLALVWLVSSRRQRATSRRRVLGGAA